jgi:2-methylcitrate dehydratase PrpD
VGSIEEAPASPGAGIADFAAGFLVRPLPPALVAKGRIHVLDTLAAIVSGSALEAGLAGRRYACAVGGTPVASILGTDLRVPLVEAALANGMAAHADESDDSHEDSQTHPGCGVVPAAVAVAEACHSAGREFLAANILGYEMTIRFAQAIGSAMTFKASSLSSHAYGPLFGAGYASGALMRFDANAFKALVNYLAQEASGLTTWRLDQAHTLKSYVFAGMPASNGVKAAALVRSGFTGGGDVLDRTNRNLLDAICPAPRPEALTDGLGERFSVLETDIKKYSVGFPIASPLAALESILGRGAFAPADVDEIRVYYDEDWYKVIGDQTPMPDVNLRYCLAVTVLDGKMTFDASHDPARMAAPDVRAMGSRVRLLGPKPAQDRFAVTIEVLAKGRVHEAFQDRNVPGRFENPLSDGDVRDKARELMEPVIGAQRTRRVIELTDRLELLPDLSELIAALAPRDRQ